MRLLPTAYFYTRAELLKIKEFICYLIHRFKSSVYKRAKGTQYSLDKLLMPNYKYLIWRSPQTQRQTAIITRDNDVRISGGLFRPFTAALLIQGWSII